MDGTTLPVWALAENDGTVRRAVVAWKDGGRADVTPWFAAVVRRAAAWLAADAGVGAGADPGVGAGRGAGAGGRAGETVLASRASPRDAARSGAPRSLMVASADRSALVSASPTPPTGRSPLLVVGVPPSPAGARRRGEDLVGALARAHAQGTRAGGVPARAVAPLRLAGAGRDQIGLGVHGRAANLAGRVRVRPAGRSAVAGARVLLVDDVLTTGATLAACRAALEAAGDQVAGAVVLAVTRPPGAPRGWLESPPGPD